MPHWRIQDLPELQHLTPQERRRVVRSSIDWFVHTKLIVLPLVLAIPAAVAGGSLLASRLVPLVVAVALLALAVFIAAYMRLLLVGRCRRGLRAHLKQLQVEEGLRFVCLECGYDLRAITDSDAPCPECGA